ncbi:MAG: winged helix DNA-binding domain-containing protein [Anaerolineales bacterium]|nr:winged helix DNA-binding domain-containing protein [Anaerolineales bacterium]
MGELKLKKIEAYRRDTFRTSAGMRIKNRDEAIQFANQRGFIYFWPIKDITLPSLWVAVAGDRPVADAHDDPGHVTWGWKDGLLGKRRWYYAKVLRKKSTIISLDTAPYFYALSENYGAPEEDYLVQYMQGRLTQEAKVVYETLLNEGPLDTISLRRAARLSSRESDSRFNRAMSDLQSDLKIIPVGTSQAGGWRYSFVYDLVHRHFPELPEQARGIQEPEARTRLLELYMRSVGAASRRDFPKLFRWRKQDIDAAIDQLVESGAVLRHLILDDQLDEWVALPDML